MENANVHQSKRQPESYKSKRLLSAIWMLTLAVLVVALGLFYQYQLDRAKQQTENTLHSIASTKVGHVEAWLNERRKDLITITTQKEFIRNFQNIDNSYASYRLKDRLNSVLKVKRYGRISALNADNEFLVDLGVLDNDLPNHTLQLIEQARQGALVQSQLFWFDGILHLDIVAPVFTHDKPRQYLGSLVVHVDPSRFLLPFVHSWPLESDSGHTELLFENGDGYMALTGDFVTSSAKLIKSNVLYPFTNLQGLKQQHSHFEKRQHMRTYQAASGGQVLVHLEPMTSVNWVLATMVHESEVVAPVHRLMLIVMAVSLSLLLLMAYTLNRVFKTEQSRLQNEQLQASQAYFMGLFMNAPSAYQSLNEQGKILDVNQAWCDLFGYQPEEVIGRSYSDFIESESMPVLKANFPILISTGQVDDVPFSIRSKDGQVHQVRLEGRISKDRDDGAVRTHCVLTDVTQQVLEEKRQRRALGRTEALLDLMLDSPALDESGLLEMGMNQLETLTNSQIAFVHFVSEDQNEIELAAWSTNTQKNYCTAAYDSHYPVEKAGIWADCVREGKPTVVNDYPNAANKKGLPEGHSHLQRFISVPIFHRGLVSMIVGIGNAHEAYDDYDVESVQLFGSELYQIVLLKRASEKLENSEKRFHHLFEKAPFAYQSLDKDGHILEVNESWLELLGFAAHHKLDLIGQPFAQFIEDDRHRLSLAFHELVRSGAMDNVLFTVRRQDGELRQVEVTGRTSLNQNNELRTHCMFVDVTERHSTERALKLASNVYDHTGEGIMVTNAEQEIVSVNPAFTQILGYSQEEVLGKTPSVIKSGRHDQAFYDQMWEQIKSEGIWQGEIWNRHRDGRLIPEWLTITEMAGEGGAVENYLGVFADISKLKASQAELDFMAHHDVLTQLPNRRRFNTALEYAIAHSKRDHAEFAVLMLDLDRFKDVNDSYGHAAGDDVLIHVSSTLQEMIREVDVMSRLGGDEFAILLENLSHTEDAARIARNVIEKISEPFSLSTGQRVSVGCSIGISLFPQYGLNPEDLMQQADSALYLAKQKGRGTYEYFSPEMTELAQERMAIESELKIALKQNQFRLFFQPQVEMDSGRVKGAEALIRWQHPEKGLLSPAYFIEVAEESGLIGDIGAWVLNEACRQAKVWRDSGFEDLVFAVNVSPKQLVYSDLFQMTMNALDTHGLPAEQLELEITESGLMDLGEDAVSLFEMLRGLGVRVAIDDFGTGYSSLSYLKELPLDLLKIDKSFVDAIPSNEAGMQIVNTIISMAHNLRLAVLAEGVEEDVQKRFLEVKGCDYFQGYVFAKPLPADEFATQYLKQSNLNLQ